MAEPLTPLATSAAAPGRAVARQRSAVDKALEVLGAMPDGGQAIGVSELGRSLGLTKSTTFRLLSALERNGYCERTADGYRLSHPVFELGARVYGTGDDSVMESLGPHLVRLAEQTRETVHVGVLRDADVVLIGRLPGLPSPGRARVGARYPAVDCALGRALLAHDPVTAESVLQSTAPADVAPLRGQITLAHRAGLAISRDELRRGLTCVAIALRLSVGGTTVAVSVGGATSRVDLQTVVATLRAWHGPAARAIAGPRRSHASRRLLTP